jgi:Ca2+-binding EF-hand superfamily protein
MFREKVDAFELEACLDQFLSLIPENSQGLDPSNFEKCLGPIGLERSLISERVFRFFDGNGDGLVSFEEFCKGLSVLTKGDFDERVYRKVIRNSNG